MIKRLDTFLSWWWEGLTSPWSRSLDRYQSIKYDLETQKFEDIYDHKKPYYIEVSNDQILSATLPSEFAEHAERGHAMETHKLNAIIERTLPFTANEVYAKVSGTTVLAVLKSDLSFALSDAANQGLNILGLILKQNDSRTYIPFTSKNPGGSGYRVAFLALISFIALGVIYQIDKVQEAQAKSKLLTEQVRSTRSEVSVFEPNNSPDQKHHQDEGNHREGDKMIHLALNVEGLPAIEFAEALQAVSATLNTDTSLDQVSLEHQPPYVVMIIDASSANAAAQLTSFEKNFNFTKSEFVSSISFNPDGSTERYRLKTLYQRLTESNKENKSSAHIKISELPNE